MWITLFMRSYACIPQWLGNVLTHKIPPLMECYLKPIVYRVERACNEEVTYDGIQIKKGMVVTVSAFALHYDEDYYPDPYRFNPDR